jgi:regulator of RNase E activity RraA
MSDLLTRIGGVTTPTLTTQLMKNHGLNNVSIRAVAAINPNACRFAGPAYTIRYIPLREDLQAEQYLDHPNNQMRPAIESIPAGSVLVLDANQRSDVGMLGGNLITRMQARGVAGAVTDGGMRDIPELRQIDFPMFVREFAPPPSFTKLMIADVQCPVSCGGVAVFPGDIVVGDSDGVVVVPAHLAAEVCAAGLAQDAIEDYVQRRLARGEPLPGLYPPSEQVQQDYQRWLEAGKPDSL